MLLYREEATFQNITYACEFLCHRDDYKVFNVHCKDHNDSSPLMTVLFGEPICCLKLSELIMLLFNRCSLSKLGIPTAGNDSVGKLLENKITILHRWKCPGGTLLLLLVLTEQRCFLIGFTSPSLQSAKLLHIIVHVIKKATLKLRWNQLKWFPRRILKFLTDPCMPIYLILGQRVSHWV